MIRRQDCPVCKKPLPDEPDLSKRHFPFCSSRCRQVDLFRLSEGRYAIVEDVDPLEAELLQFDPDITIVTDSDDNKKRPL